jgi:hypothetical protein
MHTAFLNTFIRTAFLNMQIFINSKNYRIRSSFGLMEIITYLNTIILT